MTSISNLLLEKIFIVLCLSLAIYLTVTCPCKTILMCNRRIFYSLLVVPLLYVIYRNTIE